MKEFNFQCSDCGLCFQDTVEGAIFAKEHVKLTGHNEDLVCFEVDELLKLALKNIEVMKVLGDAFYN